ncbi:MAG: hypothetical protein ACPF8V_05485 [Luteibaculum sp.]
MKLLAFVITLFFYTGVAAQWVSVTPQNIKRLCRDKIRVFELNNVSPQAEALNQTLRNYFTTTWKLCEVEFIPYQENNPEYHKEGFHVVFFFNYNKKVDKKLLAENEVEETLSFHLNFNSCKPIDRDKQHYMNTLISYDLWRGIPIEIEKEGGRDKVMDFTYSIGLKNKLELTLHCFETLLNDILEERKTDLVQIADKNIKSSNFPIIVFNKGDLPDNANEPDEIEKYSDKKVLVVEPQYFKNSKQGFVNVGVVLIYPYRVKEGSDLVSVYEINSGKLIGRFSTSLEKEGVISKRELIQILTKIDPPKV